MPRLLSFAAACSCLAACSASLPEWSKNSPPAKHVEPAHHRDESTHVDLPLTLLWRRTPEAPLVQIAVMMAVASLCMLGCACWVLITARRSFVEGTKALDGNAQPTLETLPLSPSCGHSPAGHSLRGQRISRELFVDIPTALDPAKSHTAPISEPPIRLPRHVSPLARGPRP